MAEAKKKDQAADKKIASKTAELAADTVEKAEPPTKTVAKAGKRSAKALAESEQKQAKEARKDEPPKEPAKKPAKSRSRVEKAGKKYQQAAKLVDKTKQYSLSEAVELAVKSSITKFDATVEIHVNLGVDPKQADQNVRDMVVLPAGTGKSLTLAAFVEGDDIAKAQKSGADIAGADKIQEQLEKQQVDFDLLVATPALMPKLSKYARLLGPRGLMPNPKSGTVAADVSKAVLEAKAGRVEYRVDSAGIVHLGIGKVSFGPQKLLENAEAVLASIKAAKPASLKGVYIKSAHLTTTMGPGIKLQP